MTERNTVQKSAVYAALCRLDNHPTAEEVFADVRLSYPNISRATVYRILNQLTEKGRISRLRFGSEADHFDHRVSRHYHVVCTGCGRISDVDLPEGVLPLQLPADYGGYMITGCSLQFEGLCPDCRTKEELHG